MDIQERLTAFAMLGATWVMWLLVLLSIVSIAIILERAYYLFQQRDDIDRLRDDLRKRLDAGDVEGARTRAKQSPSVEGRVALAGLEAHGEGKESAEKRMDATAALARLGMERNLAFLGTVGNNAPFVGLLGTVIGIIRAFHELNESAGQVSQGLMQEIGEALVATAIGLLVALPAVAFFNLFLRVIKARMARADAMGKYVLAFMGSTAKRGKKPKDDDDDAAEAAEE